MSTWRGCLAVLVLSILVGSGCCSTSPSTPPAPATPLPARLPRAPRVQVEAWRERLRAALVHPEHLAVAVAELTARGLAEPAARAEVARLLLEASFDALTGELVAERLAYDQAAAAWPGAQVVGPPPAPGR